MSAPSFAHTLAHACDQCRVHSSFCPLPPALHATFDTLRTTVSLRKAEVAFHETEPCHSVFIICSGRMKLTTASTEGRVLLLRYAGPGEVLGLPEAVLGQQSPYESSAIAVEPTVCSVVPAATFVRFLSSYPEMCMQLTVSLSEQYKEAQRETRFLAFGETSTARLAQLLLNWSSELGEETSDGVRIPSHHTHTDLAQSIGATRETVTRILSNLSHRGIVERQPDSILIRSASELTRLGEY